MNEIITEPENLKVLLVDDEPANIMLLTKMLSAKGCNDIVSTLNPREVVSIFQEHCFDLILLDINMPEMDGYEVLKQLRQIEGFNGTQVVAITGDIYPKDIKKGLDSGFSDYLTKPLGINTLFETVDKVLQRINS